jgi:methyl-accepting chemotaxis protein
MKIGVRLSGGFAAILLLMMLVSGVALIRLNAVAHSARVMVDEALVKERVANRWANLLGPSIVHSFGMAKATDSANEAYFKKNLTEGVASINPVQEEMGKLLVTPEEKKSFDEVVEARKKVLAHLATINKLKAAGDSEAAGKLADTEYQAALQVYGKAVQQIAENQRV